MNSARVVPRASSTQVVHVLRSQLLALSSLGALLLTACSSSGSAVTPVAPSITTQPADSAVLVGDRATFVVLVQGTGPLEYQWQRNGSAIAGETSAILRTAPAAPADDGALFSVVIRNGVGSVTSAAARLTVTSPQTPSVAPSISLQPASASVLVGDPATFVVVASGTPAPAFQWMRGVAAIPGATSSVYTVAAAALADDGAGFSVKVTNSAGTVTSTSATLHVGVPTASPSAPAIVQHPANFAATVGGRAMFVVLASGNPAPSVQWQRNNVDIPGATSTALTVGPVDLTDDGAAFRARLSNSQGAATSGAATLTVTYGPAPSAPPQLTLQPSPVAAFVGDVATFAVAASGNPAPTYQWKRNGAPIPGASSSVYTTGALALADNGAVFGVTVTNALGSATSASATLGVTVAPAQPSAPVIAQAPQDLAATVGGTATFVVLASGNPAPSIQWQRDGADLPGATGAVLQLGAVGIADDGAKLRARVSNLQGTTTSAAATLSVSYGPGQPVAPAIVTQPMSATVIAGRNATFVVAATGNPAPAYQWKRDGAPIPGATGPVYSFGPVAIADHLATFTAVASNASGFVESIAATLRVDTPASIQMQPLDASVPVGTAASFSVTASGSPSPSYQWRRDGAAIVGGTGATYTFTTSAGDDGARFDVVLDNGIGHVQSAAATLHLLAQPLAPVFGHGPASATVVAGQPASLSVVVWGSTPMDLQWRRAGTPIPGAVTAAYTLPATTSGDDGATFDVVATNALGTTTSATATLHVTLAANPPQIAVQPQGASTVVGQPVVFSVRCTPESGRPLRFQWFNKGVPIPGAIGAAHGIGAVSLANDGDRYTVQVSNAGGVVLSAPAALSVGPSWGTLSLLAGTVAGGAWRFGSTEDATFGYSWASAVDRDGTLWTVGPRVWRFDTEGFASIASLESGSQVVAAAADGQGNLLVLDNYSGYIGRYLQDGVYQQLTTTGETLNGAQGLAAAGDGTGFAGSGTSRILRISPTGVVSTLAGSDAAGHADAPSGAEALFDSPYAMALDPTQTVLYVADFGDCTIRTVSLHGSVGTLAGSPYNCTGSVDGQGSSATFRMPFRIAVDARNRVFALDRNGKIRMVTPDGSVTTVFSAALLGGVHQSALHAMNLTDGSTRLLLVTAGIITAIDPDRGVATPYVGTPPGTSDGTQIAVDAYSTAMTTDAGGSVIVPANNQILKVTPQGAVTVLAGQAGVSGSTDGAAEVATFSRISGMAYGPAGTLYVADMGVPRIRQLKPDGSVSTLVGLATAGTSDGDITQARFTNPFSLAIDGSGYLYVVDSDGTGSGCVVRKIVPAAGATTVTTLGGVFSGCAGVAVGPDGRLIVNDLTRILTMAPDGSQVSVLAGSAAQGYADGLGADARFYSLMGMTIDSASGDLYVADANSLIRKVTQAGAVTTVAGTYGQRGTVLGPLPATLTNLGALHLHAGVIYATVGQGIVSVTF